MQWDESKHPRDKQGKFTTADYKGMSIDELKQHSMQKLPDRIKLPDEILPRSLGAMWRNEEIYLIDGTIGKFVEGSILQNKEIIACPGVKRQIDDIERLVNTYKGTLPSDWRKVKGIASVELPDGEIVKMEVHWYETDDRKVEFKEK